METARNTPRAIMTTAQISSWIRLFRKISSLCFSRSALFFARVSAALDFGFAVLAVDFAEEVVFLELVDFPVVFFLVSAITSSIGVRQKFVLFQIYIIAQFPFDS